ncbi:uncharacterized protein VICG_00906 [Vittaforma corneae ATCC 50505]|uniref:Palmitoyltransferase n=1 Tax=Vittaforma corneae (strain ATCC 50505) TaxID=993615 RepID=L2GP10_VITCO|nr:uncharacterized protein VICG_00906 [Vittaforma corneae ATCC 50505]ELA42057.1 hypothetical protein VICG_00906 [Vittaforma corneae ATCC 50505]
MEFADYVEVQNTKKFLYFALLIISMVYSLTCIGVFFCTNHWTLNLFVIYLLLANVCALYRSSTLEPGFLPTRSVPTFDLQPIVLKNDISIVPDVLNTSRIISFTNEPGNRSTYIQKYCLSCNIFRPIKTSHCADCGYCVLEKDHHCLWLNNCIGRNNHVFFLGFVYTFIGLLIYINISLHHLSKAYPNLLCGFAFHIPQGTCCCIFSFDRNLWRISHPALGSQYHITRVSKLQGQDTPGV